jgi:hypothetical protein
MSISNHTFCFYTFGCSKLKTATDNKIYYLILQIQRQGSSRAIDVIEDPSSSSVFSLPSRISWLSLNSHSPLSYSRFQASLPDLLTLTKRHYLLFPGSFSKANKFSPRNSLTDVPHSFLARNDSQSLALEMGMTTVSKGLGCTTLGCIYFSQGTWATWGRFLSSKRGICWEEGN